MNLPILEFRRGIPTYDFFENEIKDDFDLEEILDDFIYSMESGYFLSWESVICKEQKIPLKEYQKEAYENLIGDQYPILYINETARPNKYWFEIATEIAKKLIKRKIPTFEIHSEIVILGWTKLKESIEEYGEHLLKPEDKKLPIQVIPSEIRNHLEIQESIDWLLGLGQDEELTLRREDQKYRVSELIKEISKKKEAVKYYKLSINKITNEFVELLEQDKLEFERMMKKELGLDSLDEEIENKLKR